MSFLSFAYLLFLPAVFAIHWAVPARWRWATLLAASVWFVAFAAPDALVPLAVATILTWAAGLALDRRPASGVSRRFSALSVAALLAALAVFKYAGFAVDSVAAAARACGLSLHPATFRLALPLGISFWTFTAVSYLVDVRRGTVPAERHLGRFAAYVLFFPKLVSGPIERAGRFLPQIASPAPFSYERASRGMRQIALGLVRKAVVADFLAPWTDAAFARADRFHGFTLALCALLYSVQIYNDFAGYSDLAIGSARLLGIDLADNFRAPVFARSLREFWSRWHISLSTWFRDYLYIPLGGSRRGALFPRAGRKDAPPPRPLAAAAGWAATFLVVSAAWVFFRAESAGAAWAYLAKAGAGLRSPFFGALKAAEDLHLDAFAIVRAGLPVLALAVWDLLSLKRDPFALVDRLPAAARWLLHAVVVACILYVLLPQGTSSRDFIYFRF